MVLLRIIRTHLAEKVIVMNRDEYYKVQSEVKNMFERANNYNQKNSARRFMPMTEYKNNKLIEYGLYDYQTKKYVLFDIYSLRQKENLEEFNQFINDMVNVPLTLNK